MRVGILGIQHESNTFLARPTKLDDFRIDRLLLGDEILEAFTGAHHEMSGFLEGLSQHHIEAVPLFFARATPGGIICQEAAERLVSRALEPLQNAPNLDGLLVAPHGAAVSEQQRDFDGYWLALVRELVGQTLPIVCSLDPHANVSQSMIDSCNATVAYRSNPHMDQRETGVMAASLLARHLNGAVKLTQAISFPQVAISIDKQHTGDQPCLDLYALANQIQQRPGVLSNSVILGFPYADVPEFGSAFITVTDNRPGLAEECSHELSHWLRDQRHRFACELVSVEQAVRSVSESVDRVCLLDVGDNVGGGSPADGTILAHELSKQRVDRSFICIFDPESAAKAKLLGVGADGSFSMGAKTDQLHGVPFQTTATVRLVHDGKFKEHQPRHGGRADWDMGLTAVVETERGLTIMLNSVRTPPFSLGQITGLGLNPIDFRVFVAKGVNAPIAAYSPVVDRFIRVNTPGITAADMTTFNYKYRPKPLYPFEELS